MYETPNSNMALVKYVVLIALHNNYYQLSKAKWSFGDKVLVSKLWCSYRQLSSFPVVTISSPAILHTLLSVMPKANKLPLETEPVACDNNTIS